MNRTYSNEQNAYIEAKASRQILVSKSQKLTKPIWDKMESGEMSVDDAIEKVVDIEMAIESNSAEKLHEAEKNLIEWARSKMQRECGALYRTHEAELNSVFDAAKISLKIWNEIIDLAMRLQ